MARRLLTLLAASVVLGLVVPAARAEPRLFDETNARNGGADRQFGTITMLVYDFGWQLRDLGRASATAWMLFLLILVLAVVNLMLVRRIGSLGGDK